MSILIQLPAEILDHIFFYCNFEQLVMLRQICKQWQEIIDRPSRWQIVMLNHLITNNLSLWQLNRFKYLMEPHLTKIKSLHITGVKDPIVRYILKKCNLLEDLTIEGWCTLSYHALQLQSISKLRHIKLIGKGNQFFSLEPLSFAQFLYSCPFLILFHIDQCQLVLDTDTFLTYLKKKRMYLNHLNSLILSLHPSTSWSQQHTQTLLAICPNLKYIQLESSSSTTTTATTVVTDYTTMNF
ncbi:unnamed protein product [Cunninghamella blakesleeana]